MKSRILTLLVLLCTVVQTSWAIDVWDGSTKRPEYLPGRKVIIIRTAAELAYAQQHWDDDSGDGVDKDYYEHSYMLEADLDLSAYSWQPLGFNTGKPYTGIFFGNGHTIKLAIIAAADNYQGLFSEIAKTGSVENLHVSGRIECSSSRMVGGIAGQNNGLISNCWVSADVISYWRGSSNTAKVGGICGENQGGVEYCCMTGDVLNHDADVGGIVGYNNGNINHCTFYGTRTSNHSQDNEFVGDQSENLWNAHGRDLYDDATLANYLNSFSSVDRCEMYRSAIQYPNRAVVHNEGFGVITPASLGTHEGKTMRLTKAFGSLQSISVTDAGGNAIALSGNETDGYTFTMPRGGVVVRAKFSGSDWLSAYAGHAYRFVKRLTKEERKNWGYAGIWEMNTVRANKDHPAMFPVELPWRCIKMHSDRGDIVVEPFSGSGTTIIACEQAERVCYAMEKTPEYCDLAVKRWEQFTGQKAERVTADGGD